MPPCLSSFGSGSPLDRKRGNDHFGPSGHAVHGYFKVNGRIMGSVSGRYQHSGPVLMGSRHGDLLGKKNIHGFGTKHVICGGSVAELTITHTLHGTAIYAYIDPPNHPNVGIYGIRICIHGAFG